MFSADEGSTEYQHSFQERWEFERVMEELKGFTSPEPLPMWLIDAVLRMPQRP